MATILPEGKQSFTDEAGVPLAGGKLYTYAAGTSTPKATYADYAAVTANANPVILDARGEATIFWDGDYKIVLKDSADSLIWTVDHISSTGDSVPLESLASSASPSVGAGMVGYRLDATGSVHRTVYERLNDRMSAADFGAVGDFSTDDTAAFALLETARPGAFVDLLGKTYAVSAEPRGAVYFNGCFLVGTDYLYKDATPYPTPFGRGNIKTAIADNDGQYGFNVHICDVSIAGFGSKWVMIYRRALMHQDQDAAQIWAADSYDWGQTWENRRILYQDASYDTRNFIAGKMGAGRIGALCKRKSTAGVHADPVFIYSDDRGATWSVNTVTPPSAGYHFNFNGQLLMWPASVGGHDTLGWMAYSYTGSAPDYAIDAVSTADNGATWVVHQSVADCGDLSLTNYVNEMAVDRIGDTNRWMMVARNESVADGSDTNAVAYTSSDMLVWNGPFDTGLYMRSNPPQMIYEGGRFWFIGFSRDAREFLPTQSSHLCVASAGALDLWNNDGDFASRGAGWQVVAAVPDWAVGYINVFRSDTRWFGIFAAQERKVGGSSSTKRNLMCLIGDFTPVTVSPNDVLMLAPRRNEIVNGAFQLWQRGSPVAVSSATSVEAADNWFISAYAGETMTMTVQSFDVGQITVHGNPKYYARFTGTSNNATLHIAFAKIPDVRRLSGARVAVSFWAKGDKPLPLVRVRQNFGSGGSPSATYGHDEMEDVALTADWRKYEVMIDFPILNTADVIGTNDNSYSALAFHMDNSGAYDISLANVKLENSGTVTPLLIGTEEDERNRLPQYAALYSFPETHIIAAGAITALPMLYPSVQIVDTEAAAATDNLDTINGGLPGQIITFAGASTTRDVTFTDGVGNLKLAGNFTCSTAEDQITLVKRSTSWYELARSDNS